MNRLTSIALGTFVAAGLAAAQVSAQEKAAKGLKVSALPSAVQKTVNDNLEGGKIKSIGKEKEDGVEQYEIETVLNGKARDFNVDTKGNLVVVEEATTLDAVPPAARAAILKRVGAGKLRTVETFQEPGKPIMYEAGYRDSKGKGHEVLVNADGTPGKE